MITYNEKIRKIRDYSFIQQLNNVLSEAKSVPKHLTDMLSFDSCDLLNHKKHRHMKLMTILAASLLAFSTAGFAQNDQAMKFQEEQLTLTQEWDKTFPQSDKVNHSKITFHNRYGITLAASCREPATPTCTTTWKRYRSAR